MDRRSLYFCPASGCRNQWRNVHRKRCSRCGGETVPLKPVPRGIARTILVTPDIPEHWNVSLNQPVRSRRHLQDLQKRHGCHDYEGMRGASNSHVFTEGGEVRRLKHSERVRG